MTMLKVVEVLAESEASWEDAAKRAVHIASRTVRNIRSIYVQHFEAVVKEDEITSYRVNAKISFTLESETE
jgi:flavin-binding protein dodecin